MAKVGTKIGLTLKLFKDSQYEFIRPEVSIDEIDVDGNVKEQLEKVVEALKPVWDATTKQMNDLIISQMPQVNKEMEFQVAAKLKKFEDIILKQNKTINELESKINGRSNKKTE